MRFSQIDSRLNKIEITVQSKCALPSSGGKKVVIPPYKPGVPPKREDMTQDISPAAQAILDKLDKLQPTRTKAR